jgi:hypothetical protein
MGKKGKVKPRQIPEIEVNLEKYRKVLYKELSSSTGHDSRYPRVHRTLAKISLICLFKVVE